MQKLTSNNKTTLEIVCIYVRPILLMSITFLAAATSAAAAAAAAATVRKHATVCVSATKDLVVS